VTETQID